MWNRTWIFPALYGVALAGVVAPIIVTGWLSDTPWGQMPVAIATMVVGATIPLVFKHTRRLGDRLQVPRRPRPESRSRSLEPSCEPRTLSAANVSTVPGSEPESQVRFKFGVEDKPFCWMIIGMSISCVAGSIAILFDPEYRADAEPPVGDMQWLLSTNVAILISILFIGISIGMIRMPGYAVVLDGERLTVSRKRREIQFAWTELRQLRIEDGWLIASGFGLAERAACVHRMNHFARLTLRNPAMARRVASGEAAIAYVAIIERTKSNRELFEMSVQWCWGKGLAGELNPGAEDRGPDDEIVFDHQV